MGTVCPICGARGIDAAGRSDSPPPRTPSFSERLKDGWREYVED
jgi:hypothetical protein